MHPLSKILAAFTVFRSDRSTPYFWRKGLAIEFAEIRIHFRCEVASFNGADLGEPDPADGKATGGRVRWLTDTLLH